MYNHARMSGSTEDWNAYCTAKRTAQRECRKAHNNYLTNLINPQSNRPNKKLFLYIKSQRKGCNGIPTLEVNGEVVTNNMAKAEELNKYFSSVFTREDNNCPHIADANFSSELRSLNISVEGVEQLLSNIEPHKSSGPDQIPGRLLKLMSSEIAPSLTLIYQASLEQSVLPQDWKMPSWCQSLRREVVRTPLTTDQFP